MPIKVRETNQYPEIQDHQRILLGPGPSTVDPRVLEAMSTSLVGHLDPYFLQIMDRTQDLLREVFETRNPLTIPISGTGSSAMEAAVANFVEPGTRVLVCINGYFGERLADMASRYSGEVETIHQPWGEVFSSAQVSEALDRRPADIVAIVHAETSTGARQPLEEITRLVHERGGLLIVDAVTSLGGLPVRVDEVGIDICYSGTQKCLSVPPGLGPITVSPQAVDVLNNRKSRVPNWYLDLTMVNAYWGSERTYHHTAPISANYGLYEGLRLIHEEGLENRFVRHERNARILWDRLEDLGLNMHVPLQYRLPSLTTVRVPDGVNEAEVRRRLLEEDNIEIAGGLGELKGKVWRIGLMGYSSNPENVNRLLSALERILFR